MTVCASNGVTYDNFCELNQFACTHQLDLVAVSLGFCNNGPIHECDDEVATRYERKKESSRKNKLSKIGDICVNDSECKIVNSVCQFDAQNKSVRKCACRKGFIETSQA
ncbi:unnamed protein product, partial [Anisakis simplex]|uniref:Kazal-like domain-containing protein n=1 Tax=Anisakis simplex TaxID=6269 RepID=A0A0M3JKT9_ANISI